MIPTTALRCLFFNDVGINESSYIGMRSVIGTYFARSSVMTTGNGSYFRAEKWESQSDLVVLPGGEFALIEKALQIEGLLKIKRYVEGGGRCIALCGSAFGLSSHSQFLAPPLPPRSESLWALFEGKAIGPLYGEKNYKDFEGFRASLITLKDKSEGYVYNQGGPAFKLSPGDTEVEVLARYADSFRDNPLLSDLEESPPAVIACMNKVALIGCHPEIDLAPLISCTLVAEVANKVFQSNSLRHKLWMNIFNALKLQDFLSDLHQ